MQFGREKYGRDIVLGLFSKEERSLFRDLICSHQICFRHDQAVQLRAHSATCLLFSPSNFAQHFALWLPATPVTRYMLWLLAVRCCYYVKMAAMGLHSYKPERGAPIIWGASQGSQARKPIAFSLYIAFLIFPSLQLLLPLSCFFPQPLAITTNYLYIQVSAIYIKCMRCCFRAIWFCLSRLYFYLLAEVFLISLQSCGRKPLFI